MLGIRTRGRVRLLVYFFNRESISLRNTSNDLEDCVQFPGSF